jgi:hypothetical protein
MNSTKSISANLFQTPSFTKLSSGSLAEAEPLPQAAVSDETMEQLSEQIRANLMRNVSEAQARPRNDPADWEI